MEWNGGLEIFNFQLEKIFIFKNNLKSFKKIKHQKVSF